MLAAPVSFDRVADHYERTRFMPPKAGDAIARFIVSRVDKGAWILDAGCGTGRFTRPLARRYPCVAGSDVSPAMLAELRERHVEGRQPLLVGADLRALPFVDGQFAAVLAVHVLHLIEGWHDALAEMWRVLDRGGVLLLGYEDRSVSAVRDFYMMRGRESGLLPAHPGVRSVGGIIVPFLQNRYGVSEVEEVSLPAWRWKNAASVGVMLADLQARLYSSQWNIPDAAHTQLMAATRENARKVFGSDYEAQHETQTTRFVLHVVRKP